MTFIKDESITQHYVAEVYSVFNNIFKVHFFFKDLNDYLNLFSKYDDYFL